MVHNEGATVFVSVLAAAAQSDFQMLARPERRRIVVPLKMCGRFLKRLSPRRRRRRRGVVFFASKFSFSDFALYAYGILLGNR
jgi:hypothetical protein